MGEELGRTVCVLVVRSLDWKSSGGTVGRFDAAWKL